MKEIFYPQRKLVCEEWDVVVIGGGPAGCAAAVAAGESGARVLLLERTCTLGGMGTSALVPAWCPFSDKIRQINAGLGERMLKASKTGTPHIAQERLDWVPIAAEHLKRVYDEVVEQAGAKVRFDTLLVDVQTNGAGEIEAVITADKRGLRAVSARVYVDATGDADLVHRTGVSMHVGDNRGGELMPATMCFTLANCGIDKDTPMWRMKEPAEDGGPSLIQRIVRDGKYPDIPDEHIAVAMVGPGCVGFNAGHVYHVDNTDPESVSAGIIKGRRMAAAYREALAEYKPEWFGEAFLVSTGALLGVRETRRIIADYELTIEDYIARRTFPDEICRNAYFIDIHLSSEIARKGDWEKRLNRNAMRYEPGESHGIPYGSLCPKELHNVLVAGRCIGTDRTVNGSVRVMPVCLNTGEAAGLAAAMAARDGGGIRGVDVARLRESIRARGGYLPG